MRGDIVSYLSNLDNLCAVEDETGASQRATLVAIGGGYPQSTDVFLQDQSSSLVDRFLTRKLSDVEVAADISFNDRTVTLVAGHGFAYPATPMEMLEIDYNGKQYQSRVVGVSGNVISLSNPFCMDVPAGTAGRRVSPDCNVNGSVTPVTFYTSPPPGVLWDINILSVNMLDSTAMDDSTFGGIAGPIGGVLYRTVNDTMAENSFIAVDNSCYIRHCDTESPYSDKAPAGQFGFNAKRRFNGQQGDGVTRRIGGDYHKFEAIVYADLTGLDRFWNVIRGHVVED